MSEFDLLPIVFKIARVREGKNHLTWDEYKEYLNMIRVMDDLFTSIDVVEIDGMMMNIDCVLLKDVGEYKAGSRFDYIGNDGSNFLFYNTEKGSDPVMVKKIIDIQ